MTEHGEPPAFVKWLIWIFRKNTWKTQPIPASLAVIILIGIAYTAIKNVPPERNAADTAVSISGHYMRRITMRNNPELVNRIVSSWNAPKNMTESVPSGDIIPTMSWIYDHRLFRLRVTNAGDQPASVAEFTPIELSLGYDQDTTINVTKGFCNIVSVSKDGSRIDPDPVLYLEGHKTLSIDLVISWFTFSIPTNALQEMAQTTLDRFKSLTNQPVNIDEYIIKNCVNFGTSAGDQVPILYQAFNDDFLSKLHFKSAYIEAIDHLGNRIESEKLAPETTVKKK